MDRPALKTGGSLRVGVLALGAVLSGQTLAMAGGDSPPMGHADARSKTRHKSSRTAVLYVRPGDAALAEVTSLLGPPERSH